MRTGEDTCGASRYVEMKPAAGIVVRPEEYPYSSACDHLMAQDDKSVKIEPLRAMVGNWRDILLIS